MQNDRNEVGQNVVQNPGIQNVENMNGLSVVLEIANKYRNGNVVTTPAEGNGNDINNNPIRCYNCREEGHYANNCTVKLRKQDVAYLQQQLQIAQKEEAEIQSTQEEFEFMAGVDAHEETERVKVNCTSKDTLQQVSLSGTQSDNVPVYDSDGSAEECKYDKISYDKAYNDMQTKIKRLQAQLGDLKDKMNALSKPYTSNSAPSIRELKVMQTVNVIAPRIFRTNPSKTSRVDNVVPNKPVKTSVRIKPITVSQPNVIHKQQANSESNGFSSTRVNNTAKTRIPHPRSNSITDRAPSKSKSSCLSNNVNKIEENHRNSRIPKNQKYISSDFTANHDVYVLNYVNDMNSRADNQRANVSKHENKKKHKENVRKSKELGSKGSLVSSRPSKPKTCLRYDSHDINDRVKKSIRSFVRQIIQMEKIKLFSKSFVVTTADASGKRKQEQDSSSSTSTLATTITADGNFNL
nr:hypothetical protein [Tanacetum cinerariifolium]